jgi:hypothetical protein
MNVRRDPDAIRAAWLEEGPTGLPEATRRAIAVNTRTTTQRRRPIWTPQRRPSMNIYARWAVAAIAIVVAVGGAAYYLAPAGSQVGGPPNATASATSSSSSAVASATPPAPTALPSASPAILASEGFVYPGTYVPAFDPGLTFTIDREVEHNCVPGSKCRGSIDVNRPGWIGLQFGLPRIEVNVVRVDKVNDSAKPGAMIDPPADLAAWIASRPGVTVTAQKAVQVGGLAGTQLDVRTGNEDLSFGPIPGVTDVGLGLGANWTVRMFVVPVDGRQVLIILHAEDGSLTELQPLVDSIVWH